MASSIEQSDLLKLSSCAMGNLRGATRAISRRYDEALQPLGLKGSQYGLLAAIQYMESVTITDLAGFFIMDRTTLTRNLKPLEREDYLRIAAGDDRRTRVVTLTGKGREAVAAGFPLWERVQDKIVSDFGGKRFDSLLTDLTALISIAQQP